MLHFNWWENAWSATHRKALEASSCRFWREKAAFLPVAARREGRVAGDAERMMDGIFVGHHERTGASLFLSERGLLRGTRFQRKTEDQQWDNEFIRRCRGVPWILIGEWWCPYLNQSSERHNRGAGTFWSRMWRGMDRRQNARLVQLWPREHREWKRNRVVCWSRSSSTTFTRVNVRNDKADLTHWNGSWKTREKRSELDSTWERSRRPSLSTRNLNRVMFLQGHQYRVWRHWSATWWQNEWTNVDELWCLQCLTYRERTFSVCVKWCLRGTTCRVTSSWTCGKAQQDDVRNARCEQCVAETVGWTPPQQWLWAWCKQSCIVQVRACEWILPRRRFCDCASRRSNQDFWKMLQEIWHETDRHDWCSKTSGQRIGSVAQICQSDQWWIDGDWSGPGPQLLEDLGLTQDSIVKTPRVKLSADEADAIENSRIFEGEQATLFRSGTMRCAYWAQDRVDISETIKCLARVMSKPRAGHMMQLKRVARYLKGVPRKAQQYTAQEPSRAHLEVHVDSDWAGDTVTRRSTSGVIARRGRHLLRHSPTVQNVIGLSSAESEY